LLHRSRETTLRQVPVRLLICTPWYAPARAYGGIVTAATATAAGAVEAGHEVTVAATDADDDYSRVPREAPAEPAGADVIRFENLSRRLAATHVVLPRGLRRWLRNHIEDFDVVLLQDVYSAVSVLAARASADARVPYVLQSHGTLPATPERGRSAAKRAFLTLWGGRTVREAAACLYLSELERQAYLAEGADSSRLQAMPPPLDLPDPGNAPRAPVPTVVYLGRLHPIKRIDVLIDAFARVRSALRARLEVIGPPSRYGEHLEAQAMRLGLGDSIAFRGHIADKEQKSRALATAHAFALLSASEGLPITALEALACGTPVVLSPGCGLPQVDGVAGVVCDGSVDGAAEALLDLLTRPDRARDLGRAGRMFVAGYRREAVVPELVSLLELVATSSRSAA
jgi:glycosyltransferase involved in cell wall biosynthesis